jgi:hypothetical protein
VRLAATAGDAHGFRVVLSLSLFIHFGWAHELVTRFVFCYHTGYRDCATHSRRASPLNTSTLARNPRNLMFLLRAHHKHTQHHPPTPRLISYYLAEKKSLRTRILTTTSEPFNLH